MIEVARSEEKAGASVMRKLTQPQNARVLRQMSVPLHTPAEQGMFSPDCDKHWARLENAQDSFMIGLRQYAKASLAQSQANCNGCDAGSTPLIRRLGSASSLSAW